MSTRLTILGSGTSHGVPIIGCPCAVCRSDDPHDHRTRASAFFTLGEREILIDSGPELRLQALARGLNRVDAVLYTHHHADHVVGLDDLRVFNWRQQQALPVYGSEATLARIQSMFPYAFADDPTYPSAKPRLVPHLIHGHDPFELFGRRVTPIPLLHGRLPVLGFRIGGIAYCTDCSFIGDDTLALLDELDVLILDGLRRTPHPTHFSLEQAVEVAARIGARRTYLTHIAHELAHAETNRELPPGVALAHDGLVVESAV